MMTINTTLLRRRLLFLILSLLSTTNTVFVTALTAPAKQSNLVHHQYRAITATATARTTAASTTTATITTSSRRITTTRRSLYNNNENDNGNDAGGVVEETCEVGVNIVEACDVPSVVESGVGGGKESQFSVATNLAKCICGAGSFALPHVFLEEGLLGGIVALTSCAVLASFTITSLQQSKSTVAKEGNVVVASYVDLANLVLGKKVANVVFILTVCASLGVCSTYLVFIGQTLASLSNDATASFVGGSTSNNIVRTYFPDVSVFQWETLSALVLYPLSLLRNYGIFAFTSALGVFAVAGGLVVTILYGIFVDPGGGIEVSLNAISNLRLWPVSLGSAFGSSFGTIAYLFCVNFLTFPIINSMKNPDGEYKNAVNIALSGVYIINLVFAILCLGFYGNETQDLVLSNLDNGPYLSALKVLLCIDLLFTFPIVFSSGRQILENAFNVGEIAKNDNTNIIESSSSSSSSLLSSSSLDLLPLKRALITAGGVGTCFGLAQIGGFGTVANLVGGVAQGTLAFIIPPAIAITLANNNNNNDNNNNEKQDNPEILIQQYLVAAFGILVVSSVTFFTAVGIFQQ